MDVADVAYCIDVADWIALFTGGVSQPELLQHMFQCLACICKYLVKQMATDMAQLLKHSARLRYHTAEHIRKLAASTFAYVLRQSTSLQLKQAIKLLFAGKLSHYCPSLLNSTSACLPAV